MKTNQIGSFPNRPRTGLLWQSVAGPVELPLRDMTDELSSQLPGDLISLMESLSEPTNSDLDERLKEFAAELQLLDYTPTVSEGEFYGDDEKVLVGGGVRGGKGNGGKPTPGPNTGSSEGIHEDRIGAQPGKRKKVMNANGNNLSRVEVEISNEAIPEMWGSFSVRVGVNHVLLNRGCPEVSRCFEKVMNRHTKIPGEVVREHTKDAIRLLVGKRVMETVHAYKQVKEKQPGHESCQEKLDDLFTDFFIGGLLRGDLSHDVEIEARKNLKDAGYQVS